MLKQVDTFTGTWMGRGATTYTYQERGVGQLGLRVIVHVWSDDQTIDIRLIEGDGRKRDTFKVHRHEEGLLAADLDIDNYEVLASEWLFTHKIRLMGDEYAAAAGVAELEGRDRDAARYHALAARNYAEAESR